MSETQSQVLSQSQRRSRSRSRSRTPYKKRTRYNGGNTWRVAPRPSRAVGFPVNTITKMRYCDHVATSINTGSVFGYAFSANSIFDPDRSSTGHQPSLHDTWQSIYNHYVVLNSKITITASYPSATALQPLIMGVYLNDNTTIASTSDHRTIIENGSIWKMLSGSLDDKITLTCSYNPKTYFGLQNPIDAKAEYGASFGANPTDEAFFMIWSQVQTAVAGTYVYYDVVVDYTVQVSEPKDFTES